MASPDPNRLRAMHRYWCAANYLTVGQIYLQANPLLREPLRPEHTKPRLLGHWGTSPGLSFIYVHLNRHEPSSDAAYGQQDVARIIADGPAARHPGCNICSTGVPACTG